MSKTFLKLRLPLVALALMAAAAHAQIALRLTAEKPRFLRYEPVPLLLQVTNLSGNTLTFGGKQAHERGSVTFKVEASGGRNTAQFTFMENPAKGLKLGPGETRELRVVINQFYEMQKEDKYAITAYLSHARLPSIHVSKTVHVEVYDGIPLLVKNIGMPSKSDSELIKTLKLTLMRFADVGQDIYYLRVEDDENVYASYRLGDYIDGEKPQMELDGPNLVHLLLQLRPKLFVYYILAFDGYNLKMRQKRFYKSADGLPPTLSRSTGYLRIEHARLAIEGLDYLEPADDKKTQPQPQPQP